MVIQFIIKKIYDYHLGYYVGCNFETSYAFLYIFYLAAFGRISAWLDKKKDSYISTW